MTDLFTAARVADVEAVRALLQGGADVAALDAHGFTALHCAAFGSNSAPREANLEVLRLLIAAGSPLEAQANFDASARSMRSGTPLYFAAESARDLAPVKLLLDAGAKPDVVNRAGVHVVVNAMMPEVKGLLSELTGVPVPPPPPPRRKAIRLENDAWKLVKKRIDAVLAVLDAENILALWNAGPDQRDAFDACGQRAAKRGKPVDGYCFSTKQDTDRARKTSLLPLGFWGAPAGEDAATKAIGQRIVGAFESAGFEVIWDGSSGSRPSVCLAEGM
jgi:bifunctional non-homologous end joining protein LigD